jgi:hypothetical protein
VCPFPFSRKKAKVDALMVVQNAIALELRTFTNHLQTVQMSYDNLVKQNGEIIKLLKEKKQDGQ